MPIIVFALLFFVLLALAGVILLSLALRYRAGTARRQARRWVASLNVWMTSFSAVFFLSFTLLLSILGRVSVSIRADWNGHWSHSRVARLGADSLGKPTRRTVLHSEPLAGFLIVFAIAARVVYGWWHATHPGSSTPGDQHWLTRPPARSFPWQSLPD